MPGGTARSHVSGDDVHAWSTETINTESFVLSQIQGAATSLSTAAAGMAGAARQRGASTSASHLSPTGRATAPLDTQSVGMYRKNGRSVGDWSGDRSRFFKDVVKNLGILDTRPVPDASRKRMQLHAEIARHWHALSPLEQHAVLEDVALHHPQLLGGHRTREAAHDVPRNAARDFLEHMLFTMDGDARENLRKASTPTAKRILAAIFSGVSPLEDDARTQMLSKRYENLRHTLPLDHGYDYVGFRRENGGGKTNGVYGKLPADREGKLKILIIGAGTTGITAADSLNRMNAGKIDVISGDDYVGGRFKSVQKERPEPNQRGEREMSPSFQEGGGMRFHRTYGNAYYQLAKDMGLEFVPFHNPPTSHVAILGGQDILSYVPPGGEPRHAAYKAVAQEAIACFAHVLGPIRAARDAGDVALERELYAKLEREYGGKSYQSGMTKLADKLGFVWSTTPSKVDIFGRMGQGIGKYVGYFPTGFMEEVGRFGGDERQEGHVAIVAGADAPLHRLIESSENLPQGVKSLKEQGAIRLNTSVEPGNIRLDRNGKFHVVKTDALTKQELPEEQYDHVIFTGTPAEARRIGLTDAPAAGSEPLMAQHMANAIEAANLVGATKTSVKIPVEAFNKILLTPLNLQGKDNQQTYLGGPITPDAHSVVSYLRYTLGTSDLTQTGATQDQVFDAWVRTMGGIARQQPDSPIHQAVGQFVEAVNTDGVRKSLEHDAWQLKKHYYAAFKMDAPGQTANTQMLFNAAIAAGGEAALKGVVMAGEMYSFEGGFASGAISGGIHAAQNIVVREDGTLPPESPFFQEPVHKIPADLYGDDGSVYAAEISSLRARLETDHTEPTFDSNPFVQESHPVAAAA